MKSVMSRKEITLTYTDKEIIQDKWLYLGLITTKINERKDLDRADCKSRLYRSCNADKYNTALVCGVKCINLEEPMKNTSAALVIKFEKV